MVNPMRTGNYAVFEISWMFFLFLNMYMCIYVYIYINIHIYTHIASEHLQERFMKLGTPLPMG